MHDLQYFSFDSPVLFQKNEEKMELTVIQR